MKSTFRELPNTLIMLIFKINNKKVEGIIFFHLSGRLLYLWSRMIPQSYIYGRPLYFHLTYNKKHVNRTKKDTHLFWDKSFIGLNMSYYHWMLVISRYYLHFAIRYNNSQHCQCLTIYTSTNKNFGLCFQHPRRITSAKILQINSKKSSKIKCRFVKK